MPQENTEPMTMTFSFEEMNLILRGLGELPAKESIDLIQNIHAEWNKLQMQLTKLKENPPTQRLQEVPKPAIVESKPAVEEPKLS